MPQKVPSFFVYGEPDRPIDIGFVHVETVMERRHVHNGRVAAHKHDRMAQITFWTSGRGEYFIEDHRLDFVAPAVSFVPSGVVHGFTIAPEETDAIVVSIADGALPPIRTLSILPSERPVMVRDQQANPFWCRLEATMQRLLDDYTLGLDTPFAALLAVAMNDVALLSQTNKETDHGEGADLTQAFRLLLDQHFRENWPVERYITELGTTPHLLAKACHALHGRPAKELINERRQLEAKRLLLFTVRSVEDIAYEIGFRDPAYFSRFFRKRAGQPPGEWRQAQTYQSL